MTLMFSEVTSDVFVNCLSGQISIVFHGMTALFSELISMMYLLMVYQDKSGIKQK